MKKFGVGVGTKVFPRNKFQAVQDEGEGQGCWVPKWTGLENRSRGQTDRNENITFPKTMKMVGY